MESIESINNQLISLFGIDTVTGDPIWRVVWSEDQYEKRLMDVDDKGNELLQPEVRLVPKYRQWIIEKYVLERLVVIPEVNREELADKKISYEPIFPFRDKNGNALPPRIDVCKIVIDTIYAAMGKSSLAKYKSGTEKELIERQASIKEIQDYLYGNESDVTDHLRYKTGVIVPGVKES